MSTPETTDGAAAGAAPEPGPAQVPAPAPERLSVGELRSRRAAEPGAEELPPPTSRREMKARGILLTTEIPVIDAPVSQAPVSGAPVVEAPVVEATEGPAPVPSRRALRERVPEAGDAPSTPGERTVTGRRPVVRTPATARAVRRVDETGAISAVQPVVPAAAPPVAAPPVAATGEAVLVSAGSWESAVSLPAVVLGIEDRPEPATDADPLTPPRTELLESALLPTRRESLREQAALSSRTRGLPGTAGRPKVPEASPGWSALLEEQETSTATALARIEAGLAEETATSVVVPGVAGLAAEPVEVPVADDGELEAPVAPDAPDAPEAPDEPPASDEPPAADEPPTAAPGRRSPASGSPVNAEPRRASGPRRVLVLMLLGLAIGVLIILITSGAFGAVVAEGAGGTVPWAPSSVVPPGTPV